MKGPRGKTRHRVDRNWKCSRCGKELATGGDVVLVPCPVCPANDDGSPAWMSIVEPKRARNPFPFGAPINAD